MPDGFVLRITVGDEVRVHYHPPGGVRSFVEGVVLWVDVTTTVGGGFLIDITRDVLLGHEQPVTSSFQHYVPHERVHDFPGRIEVLAGCAALHLEVGAGNPAEDFYRRLGFRDSGSAFLTLRL